MAFGITIKYFPKPKKVLSRNKKMKKINPLRT